MSERNIEYLLKNLGQTGLIKDLSDENAYHLYRVASVLFDWLVEESKPKLTRYLLNFYQPNSIKNYDPSKYYDDWENEEDPF